MVRLKKRDGRGMYTNDRVSLCTHRNPPPTGCGRYSKDDTSLRTHRRMSALYRNPPPMGCGRYRNPQAVPMKGSLYTLEVLIALSIILIALFVTLRTPPNRPESEIAIIKRTGFDAIDVMNQRNTLREWVDADNESRIETELAGFLPRNVLAEVDVCTTTCSEVNLPPNQTVVGIDYYVAGYKNTYIGKKVRAWYWRRF